MIAFLLERHIGICTAMLGINWKCYNEHYICHEALIVANTFVNSNYKEYYKETAGKEELISMQLNHS